MSHDHSLSRGPVFLCIGPEKTGTTWLYENLKEHPKVFLPKKELRYFWARVHLPDETIIKRLTGSHWHYRDVRRYIKSRIRFYLTALKRMQIKHLCAASWDFRFLFFRHTDSWYMSLFKSDPEIVSGDITSLYYRLPEQELFRISTLLPDVRIVIILRNPIDRLWSKIKMVEHVHNERLPDHVSDEEYIKLINKECDADRSYAAFINSWKQYFPNGNIHIDFYDKLEESPVDFLKGICKFLNLDFCEFPQDTYTAVNRRINVGITKDLPDKVGVHLARLYKESIDEMCGDSDYYPYAQRWAGTCNRLLEKQKQLHDCELKRN